MAYTPFLVQYNTSYLRLDNRRGKYSGLYSGYDRFDLTQRPKQCKVIVISFSDPSRILYPFSEICYDCFFLNPFQFATRKYAHLMTLCNNQNFAPKRWRRHVFSFPNSYCNIVLLTKNENKLASKHRKKAEGF